MTPQTPDMQAIIEQLEKLKRQVTDLGEIVGMAVKCLTGEAPLGKVQAQEFNLIDSKGRLAGCLCFLESGPALVLYDTNQKGRAVLRLANEGADLHLGSSVDTENAILKAGPDGSALYLSDKEGLSVSIGSINMITRQRLEALGIDKSQQHPLAIMVRQGEKVIWNAPPTPKRQNLLSRIFRRR